MQYKIRYFKVGQPPVDNLEVHFRSANISKSAVGRQNAMELVFSNPIVGFFSNGNPRRFFTTPQGDNVFEAMRADDGYMNFEERIELYVSNSKDYSEDIVVPDNLVFSGQILQVEPHVGETQTDIKVTCADRTFVLLNRIGANDYAERSAMEIIQQVVRDFTFYKSSMEGAFNKQGVYGVGGGHTYPIDARLFTEGIKGGVDVVTNVSSDGRVITCATATFITDGVNEGDVVKNNVNFSVALVREIISETELRVSKSIFTAGHTINVSDGFIQDWRADGTAFPDISFGFRNKPLSEWIDNMVDAEFTNTRDEIGQGAEVMLRPMRYYIDGYNRLHVFYPDNVPSYKMLVGADGPIEDDPNTYRFYEHKMQKSVFDIMNFVIFRAGLDMNNNTIRGFYQDPTLGGPTTKNSYRPFLSIAPIMKFEDTGPGRLTQVDSETWEYPADYGTGYVPNWNPDVTVNSDAEYNTEFRKAARRRGIARARDKVNLSANPRWRGSANLEGFNFTMADLCRLTDRSVGINRILVRIDSMQHNVTPTGWFTTLQLVEDIPLQRRLSLGA